MAEVTTESQEALVQAVKSFAAGRDEVSFEKLYKLTYKKLFAYIQMMSKDKEKTDDVLQNGYLICYRKIDQLSDPTKFMSWMKNICYHELAHSYDDRETLLSNTQSADEDVDVFDTIQDDKMEMPEKAAEDANLKKLLLKNINLLPEKQRMALIAFYFEDRSIKEIAESMGAPENTVKTYLNRARKSMNDSMKSYADANGLKLVPFAVVPFMAMLFGEEASACELLAGTGSVLWNKLRPMLWRGVANGAGGAGASSGAAGTAGTGGAGAAGANGVAGGLGVGAGAAGAGAAGLGIKIAISGLIAVLVGGSAGAFATYKYVDNKRKEESEKSDFAENPMDEAKKIIQLEEDPVQVDDTENPSDSADGAEAENKKAEENEKPEENQIPDPKEIWGDTEITEYYDSNLGVHFYLPSELSVSLETPEYWGDAGSLVYVTGMGMNNEYLFATTYATREVDASGDAAEADYRLVSDADGRIYELGFYSEYEDPGPTSAALSFRESYADKIAESAYIDPNVEPRYISFSVADTTCEKSDGSYWYDHHAPDWLEGSPSGVKEFTVGTDLLSGSYSIRCTFGAGAIIVTGADGSEKYNFHDDFNNWESSDTLSNPPTIVVEDGDKIKLDADDADCYAITFSDHKGAGTTAQGNSLSEDELKQKLADAAGVSLSNITDFAYNDYDKDGIYEAFGLVDFGDNAEMYADRQSVWYVDQDDAERVFGEGDFKSLAHGSEEEYFEGYYEGYSKGEKVYNYIETSDRIWLVVAVGYASGEGHDFFSVKNGKAYESKVTFDQGRVTYRSLNGDQLIVNVNEYDGASYRNEQTGELGDGGGHSFKPYYFFYDRASGDFKEYGGTKISRQELTSIVGFDLCGDIESSGCIVGDIFKRSNGIVTVNYVDTSDTGELADGYFYNLNITYDMNKKAFVEEGDKKVIKGKTYYVMSGDYSAAFLPEIAVY